MKKIFFIAALFVCKLSFAQITNNDLDKFVGTWRWTSGNDTVSIVLEKQVINSPTGDSREQLVGWHRYVKNGTVIESSYQHIGLNYNSDLSTTSTDLYITLLGSTRTPEKIFFTTFWDLTLHKSCSLYLILLPNSLTQATWKLTDHMGLYTGPAGTYNQFTLPQDLILTKQ